MSTALVDEKSRRADPFARVQVLPRSVINEMAQRAHVVLAPTPASGKERERLCGGNDEFTTRKLRPRLEAFVVEGDLTQLAALILAYCKRLNVKPGYNGWVIQTNDSSTLSHIRNSLDCVLTPQKGIPTEMCNIISTVLNRLGF